MLNHADGSAVSTPGQRSTLMVVALVLLVLAALLAIYWPALDAAVAYEDSPITWLSTSVLVACATLALVIAEQSGSRRWYGLALLLVLVALDERFMVHEQLRDAVLAQVSEGELERSHWLANLPMLLVPIGGLMVARALWPTLPRAARRLFIGALLFGTTAIVMDIATVALGWQVIEEILELLAELLFLCALLLARAYSGQSQKTLVPSRVPEPLP